MGRNASLTLLIFMLGHPRPGSAEWSLSGRGSLFYTDDVSIFSATRRLTRDADPTQPALDARVTGQGSDGVFEPMLKLSKAFDSGLGTTTLDLRGDGFIFFDHSQYNNGTLFMQAQQVFRPGTRVLLRYYYNPDLFIGDNEERRSGRFQIVPERVTSQIGSLRIDQEVAEGLEVKLLSRYGTRRYNSAYSQRDTDFWTVGPHLEWTLLPVVTLGLAYHCERGLANGRHQPQYGDDVSYTNHYASTDLDFELSETFSVSLAFHYEHNDWLSQLEEDERKWGKENVYQGEALLNCRNIPADPCLHRRAAFKSQGKLRGLGNSQYQCRNRGGNPFLTYQKASTGDAAPCLFPRAVSFSGLAYTTQASP